MNTNRSTDQLLAAAIPKVPVVAVPDIDSLHRQLNRRRRRKLVSAASIAGVALALLATFALPWDPETDHETAGLPKLLPSVGVIVDPRIDQDDVGVVSAVDLSADVHVYARLWGQLPVFGVDRETQRMHHVGWIESETTLPVDLQTFSKDQQQSIKAVLDQGSSHNSLNL